MSLDVFDPQKHKIVAIVADGPDKGQHVHVSLLELAMDMSKVDFAPFFARMQELEDLAHAQPVPVQAAPVDLGPVFARIEALEQRPVGQAPLPVQSSAEPVDLAPILDAISNLSERMAAIEQVVIQDGVIAIPSQSFDPAPLLQEIEALQSKLSTRDAQLIKQERVLQTMAQFVDGLGARIDTLEQIDITLLDERKAG